MVMMLQMEATGFADSVQLVVGKAASKDAARRPAGAVETIVGPIHLVDAHHSL